MMVSESIKNEKPPPPSAVFLAVGRAAIMANKKGYFL